MESVNAVILVGCVELDLETTFEGDRHQVTQFTLRLEDERDGQVHRVYVPVISYGRAAAQAAERSPGDLIGVQGKLVWRRSASPQGTPAPGQLGRLMVMAASVVCIVPAPVAA